jgi:signal transduction histidine kinase
VSDDDRIALLEQAIAAFGHRVRNPLHSMVLAVALLREHTAPQSRRHVDVIDEDVRRIEQIVAGFMRLTQLRLGPVAPIDVCLLAEEVVAQWISRAAIMNIDVDARLDDVPSVLGDGDLVREALGHLVANSIDAGRAGGRVIVRVEPDIERAVALIVEDDGDGIAPDVRPRVFEPFFTSRERRAGIGLPLARRIAALHGGDVRLEPRDAGGTRATLVLAGATLDNA